MKLAHQNLRRAVQEYHRLIVEDEVTLITAARRRVVVDLQ